MSEQDSQVETNGQALSPDLQRQYLQLMGVQTWQARVPAEVVAQADTQINTQLSAEANYSLEAEKPSGIAENVEALTDTYAATDTVVNIDPVSKNEADAITNDWQKLASKISDCQACALHQTRTEVVIAEGETTARFMFVATAPAMQAAGAQQVLNTEESALFTKMLNAIDVEREQIYLTSLLKCQITPQHQVRETELLCCDGHLQQQIDLLKPDLIIALGETAAQQLLVSKKTLHELRQKFYQSHSTTIMVMPSLTDLIEKPEEKRNAWQDLLRLKERFLS